MIIATYHRILNDSDELVECWLIDKRVETCYSETLFFYENESSEDNLMMWFLGGELVKKHGRFISRNGSGGGGGIDPDDGSYGWVKDL